jgi:hypothetical protein
MPHCSSCGAEIDPLVTVFFKGLCMACNTAKNYPPPKKAPAYMEELQSMGVDLTREVTLDFGYVLWSESDVNEMVQRVNELGYRTLVTSGWRTLPDKAGWRAGPDTPRASGLFSRFLGVFAERPMNRQREWMVRCRARLLPSEERIIALRDLLCDIADEYQNWFMGFGILRSDAEDSAS